MVTGETPGALAQGIGAALLEQIVCDADGQLLTASMGDYLLPSAPDVPELEMVHRKQWRGGRANSDSRISGTLGA
ncbi:molybdopterin cofactor-binding domain-containing protein [Paraburkholderia aspalathi]|uniref:molybdopterin cofactor-binding domain-containing protein n=1 Tax=Paraburkholderia aspalathi TaxID=1324617 RepID=UPI003C90C282